MKSNFLPLANEALTIIDAACVWATCWKRVCGQYGRKVSKTRFIYLLDEGKKDILLELFAAHIEWHEGFLVVHIFIATIFARFFTKLFNVSADLMYISVCLCLLHFVIYL